VGQAAFLPHLSGQAGRSICRRTVLYPVLLMAKKTGYFFGVDFE